MPDAVWAHLKAYLECWVYPLLNEVIQRHAPPHDGGDYHATVEE